MSGSSRADPTYAPFTDPRTHRIRLDDLTQDRVRETLRAGLTLTGMYDLMERLRTIDPVPPSGTPSLTETGQHSSGGPGRLPAELPKRERQIHTQGLVSILRELHNELDAAVLDAYGWSDLIPHLVGRPGAITPFPGRPAEQAAAEEEILVRLWERSTPSTRLRRQPASCAGCGPRFRPRRSRRQRAWKPHGRKLRFP